MAEVKTDRIGSALRGLAADVVTERRRVALLQREIRELKAQLATLQDESEQRERRAEGTGKPVGAGREPSR